MDVAGRHCRDAERLGQLAQHRVATSVAALERRLQLDEEAVTAERLRERRRRVRISHPEPMPRAARQTDKSFVQLLQHRLLERGLQQLALFSLDPRPCMGGGQQPAEVRVARGRLDE